MKKTRPFHSGFSLVELLVAMAIIAMLVALLFPALKKAKDTARSIACLSQLRQFGQANHMYAEDNKGYLPVSVTTSRLYDYLLSPYVGYDWDKQVSKPAPSLYHCPMGKLNSLVNAYRSRGYAYNRDISYFNVNKTAFLPSMETPALMLLMLDAFYDYSSGSHEEHIVGQGTSNPGGISLSASLKYIDYQRHSGQVNVLFGDAHVKSCRPGLYVATSGGFIVKGSKWTNGGNEY